ncbi:MAG: YdcF family protein [Pyrinomonadaceae bacterium]
MSERTPEEESELSDPAEDSQLLSPEELQAALHGKSLSEEQRQAVLRGWQRLAKSNSPAGWVTRMAADPAFPTVTGDSGRWRRRYQVLKYLGRRMALGRKVMFISTFIIAPALLLVLLVALRIYTYGNKVVDVKADAAIVLGAAVWGNEVSPVFRERINHALELYRAGKVRKIIFTGGQGNKDEMTEAAEARQYAIKNGIPARDILIEERSHTTYENVVNAKQLADANGLKKVLIVSDPLHMRRAVTMAGDVGLDAYPSPTPTTKYQGWRSQMVSLADETYHYIGYLAGRVFNYELPVSE